MSAFHQYNCPFTDRDELVEELEHLEPRWKGNIETHDVAQPLFGYMGDQRKQTANVIVRRQHVGMSSNDLGFVKQEDGSFKAIISDFDRGKYNDQWLGRLNIGHNQKRAVDKLRQQGFVVRQETDQKNGHRRVIMERQKLLGR